MLQVIMKAANLTIEPLTLASIGVENDVGRCANKIGKNIGSHLIQFFFTL